MNEHIPTTPGLRPRPRSTRAADGLPRRMWTAEEVNAMLEAGIVHEDDRFELIGGELIEMAAKGNRHELLKLYVGRIWGKRCPDDVSFICESPLRLGPHDEPEPDFIFFSASQKPHDVRGGDVLLVVEVADTSLSHDHGIKSRLYASFGVRDYWVIHAQTLESTVHREPGLGGYRTVSKIPADQQIMPLYVPALAVRLADFDMTE